MNRKTVLMMACAGAVSISLMDSQNVRAQSAPDLCGYFCGSQPGQIVEFCSAFCPLSAPISLPTDPQDKNGNEVDGQSPSQTKGAAIGMSEKP